MGLDIWMQPGIFLKCNGPFYNGPARMKVLGACTWYHTKICVICPFLPPESDLSLPYHKPKPLTLNDFFSKKPSKANVLSVKSMKGLSK